MYLQTCAFHADVFMTKHINDQHFSIQKGFLTDYKHCSIQLCIKLKFCGIRICVQSIEVKVQQYSNKLPDEIQ